MLRVSYASIFSVIMQHSGGSVRRRQHNNCVGDYNIIGYVRIIVCCKIGCQSTRRQLHCNPFLLEILTLDSEGPTFFSAHAENLVVCETIVDFIVFVTFHLLDNGVEIKVQIRKLCVNTRIIPGMFMCHNGEQQPASDNWYSNYPCGLWFDIPPDWSQQK